MMGLLCVFRFFFFGGGVPEMDTGFPRSIPTVRLTWWWYMESINRKTKKISFVDTEKNIRRSHISKRGCNNPDWTAISVPRSSCSSHGSNTRVHC